MTNHPGQPPASQQGVNVITSLPYSFNQKMEQHNLKLEAKFQEIRDTEVRFEEYNTTDAEYIFVAYGLSARICQKAMDLARTKA